MKIQKIVQVKNIGKFENYSAYGNVTFADITLIYGENGKGKTTLCSIFRSLKSGSVALLTEKKRVGITQPIVINMLLENNFSTQFNETTNIWTHQNPDIDIFDSYHVNNNVYSGDHVDHSHKKNLYYLVIGETGVRLAQEIEQIDADNKTNNDLLKQRESEIKGHIVSNCTVDSFINLQMDPDFNQELVEIDKEIRALEEAEKIQSTACSQNY